MKKQDKDDFNAFRTILRAENERMEKLLDRQRRAFIANDPDRISTADRVALDSALGHLSNAIYSIEHVTGRGK